MCQSIRPRNRPDEPALKSENPNDFVAPRFVRKREKEKIFKNLPTK
jgi:hypothetical protein